MLISEKQKEQVSRILAPLLNSNHTKPLTKLERLALQAAIHHVNGNYDGALDICESIQFLLRDKHD